MNGDENRLAATPFRPTGLWTSCWMLFFLLAAICLAWMHIVVRRLMRTEVPKLMREIDA